MDICVSKYGGSMLADYNSFAQAAEYIVIRAKNGTIIPMLSAPLGVTNVLKEIYIKRQDRKDSSANIDELRNRYFEILKHLPEHLGKPAMKKIDKEMELLEMYAKIGAEDAMVGAGEGHSGIILCPFIEAHGPSTKHVNGPDAGFKIKTNRSIDLEKSRDGLRDTFAQAGPNEILVLTGYLGRHVDTNDYRTATRNSTDTFAAAFADEVDADAIEIVKDVPGVYRVEPAYGDYGLLDNLSYDEIGNMSWRDSPVVHPEAIKIARLGGRVIVVKDLESSGTVISQRSQTTHERPVAAIVTAYQPMITIIDNTMDLGEGRGYLASATGFEASRGHSVNMNTTSPTTISYTIPLGDGKTPEDINELLASHLKELEEHLHSLGYEPEAVKGEIVGTVTIIGDAMQGRKGTLSKIYSIVEKAGTSTRANTQTDERYSPPTISFAVDADRLKPTVKALCEELFE